MAEALQAEHIEELGKVFNTFDSNNKGSLDSRELGACFRCFGYLATEADLQEAINEVGGVVDFQQFVHIMTKKMKDCDIIAEIKQAFKQLDTDGDMFISKAELKEIFQMLTESEMQTVEIEELMREADVDGDGRISQLDFINILTV